MVVADKEMFYTPLLFFGWGSGANRKLCKNLPAVCINDRSAEMFCKL